MPKTKILCIVGSTAPGKSDIAIDIALKTGAEILSCDSLLVYKNLSIGTAKPSVEEQRGVTHYGIDLVEPNEAYNAGDFVRYARPILDRAVAENRPLLIVGGTGFYLKALLCGVWDAPPTQPEIRAKYDSAENAPKFSNEKLFEILQEKDAEYATKVQMNDRYRVLRALEIIESTGEKLSESLKKRELQNGFNHEVKILGILRKKLELEKRIQVRTNALFSQGLIQECKTLFEKYGPTCKPFSSVGYFEVHEFLEGRMTLPECRERVFISTRQLAKKQMTFFKTFPIPIEWIDLPLNQDKFTSEAIQFLQS
jgi:tRNA dimethylallyltransferase